MDIHGNLANPQFRFTITSHSKHLFYTLRIKED